jgi:PAS domain S-box-containing protein
MNRELGLDTDVIGRDIFELFPFLQEKVRDEYRSVFESGEILVTEEVVEIEGREIITETRKIPKFEKDEVTEVITVIKDITERKLAEEELKNSEERLRILFESAPDAIYLCDLKGNLMDGNRAAEELIGFAKEELVGKNFSDVGLLSIEQIPRAIANLEKNACGEPTGPDEFALKRKDGDYVTLEIRSFPVQIEGQTLSLGIARDITERKKAAQDLEHERLRLAKAQEIGSIGTWELDIVENVLSWTKENHNIFGVPEGTELTYEAFLECVHPDDRQYVDAEWMGGVAGEPYDIEHRITANGQVKWVREKAELILNDEGKVVRAIGVTQDVTERKKVREALRESEEQYRSLVSNIPSVIWRTDRHGNTSYISPVVEQVYGYSPEEVYAGGSELWFGRIHPEDVSHVKGSYEKLFTEQKALDIEYRLKRKDRKWIWIRDRSIGSYTKDGVDYADGVFTDITIQKEAKQALELAHQELHQIFDVATPLCLIGTDHTIINVNGSFCSFFDIDQVEVIGKKCNEIFDWHPCHDETCPLKNIKTDTDQYEFEAEKVLSNGRKITFIITAKPYIGPDNKMQGIVESFTDITERKKAEEALRESENKFSKAFKSNASMMALSTLEDGLFFDANDEFLHIFGYDRDEVIGKNSADLQLFGDIKQRDAMKEIVRERGNIRDFELIYRTKHGELRHGLFSGETIHFKNQECWLTVMHDITERKRAEEQVERIFNMTDYMVCVASLDGYFKRVNSSFEQILGYSPEELLSKPFFDFIHPDDVERTKAVVEEKLLAGIKAIAFENRYRCKDGSYKWLSWTSHPVPEENITYAIAYDITERKEAEEALRVSEEKFSRAFSSSPNTLVIVDLQARRRIEVNDTFLRITGYSREELLSTLVDSLMIDKERFKQGFQTLLNEGSLRDFELRIRTKSGQERTMLYSGTIMEVRGKKYAIVAGQDITERKRAEEELLRYACIVSNSSDMMAILDNNFVYLGANDAYLASFGVAKDEVVGHTVAEVFGKEFFEAIMKPNAERCLEGNKVNYENWFQFPVHGSRFMSVSYSPYIGPDGGIRGFVVNAKDITDRKRAEEALREEEELARACLNASSDMVYLVDIEGNVLTVNDIAARNFSMTADELVSTNIFSYFPPELAKSRREHGDKAVRSGKHVRFQDEREGKFYDISICPAFNVEGNVDRLAVFVTDITERKLGEEEIFNYQEKLRSLASELSLVEERERRRLATELHDNTSQELALSLIKLQAVRKSVGESSRKALDDICESLQKTSLDVRNLTFELCSPTLYNFGLETAITELLEDRLGKAGDISYNFHDDKEPKPLSEDVKITLFQAVRELLTNVTKHAQAQNVLVDVTKADSKVKIAINDDGAGFDAEKVESHDRPKSGFGLFNVKERLEHIGGSFKIKSSPGKGTSIVLEAPLQQ